MAEKLEIYDLDGKFLKIQDRKEFYSEIKEEYKNNGKITKKVKRVTILLMNSSGRIYLQKRSKIKKQNSGLYDKSVGGHVVDNDSYELTVVKECAEELGFPATILSNDDFSKSLNVTDLSIIGIFKKIDFSENDISIRVNNDGSIIKQSYISSIYVGYYDGAIRFADGESSGIEVFSLEELKEEINNNSGKFTENIKFMIEKYSEYLVAVK